MTNIQKKTMVAIAVLCMVSVMALSQTASAEPTGYKSKYVPNTSDFVFQKNIWHDKEVNAALALEQLQSMHENSHRTTGCFNGIVCIHSLFVNSRN